MEGGPAALQAHAAGAGRELAQSEAGGLKASADREQANAEAEWRQLTQLLEHARRQRVRRPRSPNLHAHSINHMRGLRGLRRVQTLASACWQLQSVPKSYTHVLDARACRRPSATARSRCATCRRRPC